MKAAVLFVIAFATSSVFAGPIYFTSGTDDGCEGCTLSANANPGGQWATEADINALAGTADARWIQSDTAWDVATNYQIFEFDFMNSSSAIQIDSLFLSGDGSVEVFIDDTLIWSSLYIADLWRNTIVNVVDELGSSFTLGAGQRLNFNVANRGGPTGLIYSGNATMVPEPATALLLLSGLLGLRLARTKIR